MTRKAFIDRVDKWMRWSSRFFVLQLLAALSYYIYVLCCDPSLLFRFADVPQGQVFSAIYDLNFGFYLLGMPVIIIFPVLYLLRASYRNTPGLKLLELLLLLLSAAIYIWRYGYDWILWE